MPESNSLLVNIWRCFLSPKLYRIYNLHKSGPYLPNTLENWGDTIIRAYLVLCHAALYASPLITYSAYKRGYFTPEGQIFLLKLGSFGAAILIASFILRAFGRATNPTYVEFNEHLRRILANYNNATKRELQNYEFDYSWWPVDFKLKSNDRSNKNKTSECGASCSASSLCKAFKSPFSFLGYAAIHSFGIKLIYPGSISALNYLIKNNLDVGRKKLIEDKASERFKLETPDGNHLDTMFVDSRGKTVNGSTLVICTEGNAGFYEIGIMVTPLELGYSVLGWNHPGFACSTGTPYPDNERCAAETVFQFALERLNFTPDNIILFGWSIGGFASSHMVTVYPEVKAVILDATFDDILPLALKQMPKFLEPIVNVTIRNHANLDVASQLIQYNGPILLIRRSEDEIISLTEGDVSTNRGNHLLLKILKARYPKLITSESEMALWLWFGASTHKKDQILEKFQVDLNACSAEYGAYRREHDRQYPSPFGENFDVQKKMQMSLYLASIYMIDFPSTHCTSLPSDLFNSFADTVKEKL